MRNVTYKELLDFLKSLEQNADNRLEDNVTAWDMEQGEYYPTELLTMEDSDGIMEAGTMFLGFGLEGG